MSVVTQLIQEAVSIPEAGLAPKSQSAGAYTSAGVDMRNFVRAAWVLQTGVLGASATVDAKLVASQSSNMSSPSDVTGAALTQILKATGDNTQYMLELTAAILETLLPGYRYVAIKVTVGVAASLFSVAALGIPSYNKPASQFNDTTVVQEVHVP